jgi:PKD repeat protein
VTFTNLTTGPGTWLWDFGDGTSSTKRNPLPHTYPSGGTYHVSLSGTRGGVTDVTRHDVTVAP